MKKVIIIDYEGSNLFSVMRAFEHFGVGVKVSNSPADLLAADAAVLPGVGAFGAAMERLIHLGLAPAIHQFIDSSKPFLGICLGMQLLFSSSEEFGTQRGLGVLPGQVKRFPSTSKDGSTNRVPQIGWNTIARPPHYDRWDGTPLVEIPNSAFMYFVHSFYCLPEDPSVACSLTNYAGLEYCSSLKKYNLFAAQFHPEKSAQLGLSIYKNWAIQAGILS